MFKISKCKHLGDFHDFYLLLDSCLLFDCVQKFRKRALNFYGIDISKVVSLPAYTLQAALKFSKIKLELITDQLAYEMVESGVRGVYHKYINVP